MLIKGTGEVIVFTAPSQICRLTFASSAAILLAVMAGSPAQAATGEELVKTKGCFVCHGHKGEEGGLGPSFGDIARRFQGLKNAKIMLLPVIHNGTGSDGHWDATQMPPEEARQPVSDEEAEILIEYILNAR